MNSPSDKLRSILGAPGWERFLSLLREHRDAGRLLPATVTLPSPSEEERRRLAQLMRSSRSSRAGRLRYDLAEISRALAAAGLPGDWLKILEILHGPIPVARLAERAQAQAWIDLWECLRCQATPGVFVGHAEWLAGIRRDGLLRKIPGSTAATARDLVGDAVRLLAELPLASDEALARVAARFFGSSHALDPDRPLANLVLRGLALRAGLPVPTRVEERRHLWEEQGIVCDELSAPVLTFNLGLGGDESICRLAEVARMAIQPLHLTTRLLWATDWARIIPPPRIFVCENPAIVALASDAYGLRCAPLVCVDGEPKTAARLLLRALRDRGTRLFYHGDFDWGGVAIANRLFTELGAQPWCYDLAAYEAASGQAGRPLIGSPLPTEWSPGLAERMRERGRAYDEEGIVETFLAELVVE
jgi:uncharacterized protein (TIGR02679 family)